MKKLLKSIGVRGLAAIVCFGICYLGLLTAIEGQVILPGVPIILEKPAQIVVALFSTAFAITGYCLSVSRIRSAIKDWKNR